nr:immunoglobulin light chain junction region [Macaca mulatta]
RQHYYSTPYSF